MKSQQFSWWKNKRKKENLTFKQGGVGSRLGGGASPTPSQSSEKTLTEAEIAVSMIIMMSMMIMSMIMSMIMDVRMILMISTLAWGMEMNMYKSMQKMMTKVSMMMEMRAICMKLRMSMSKRKEHRWGAYTKEYLPALLRDYAEKCLYYCAFYCNRNICIRYCAASCPPKLFHLKVKGEHGKSAFFENLY